MELVKDYLAAKSWQHKNARNQFCVQVCPICRDEKWHFYISADTGAWDCKKCFSSGSFNQLQRRLGDNGMIKSVGQVVENKQKQEPLDDIAYLRLHNALLSNNEVMSYLINERELSEETIKHFRLGLEKQGNTAWLAIPHFSNGKLLNIKYRSLLPAEKQFRRVPERPSILFNEDCLNDSRDVFITEGEMDAISLWQIGYKNVVGTTAGAGSFKPEWHEKLEDTEQIYLCFDNDEAGQKGAHTVADKLGFERSKNILLPKGQDINEFLKEHSRESFEMLALQAKKFAVPFVLSIQDVFQRYDEKRLNQDDRVVVTTEWPNVNKHIGSFDPGNLIILSAIAKTGKTSFALNIAYYNALLGKPCFFYCLEMSPENLVLKLSQMHFKRHLDNLDSLSESERDSLSKIPIYFGSSFGSMDSKEVFEKIKVTVKRYDVELVVFDNLHYMVRETKHIAQEIGIVTKGFKMIAEELGIPILLIAQPRKTAEGQMPTMMDLKDSSSIGTDSDQVIILWRNTTKTNSGGDPEELDTAMEPVTIVRVDASRYGPGGQTVLYFDGARSKFRQVVSY